MSVILPGASARLADVQVSICVNRLDPPLQVSHLSIETPSIVRLRLTLDGTQGEGYAWTLTESDAFDLEQRLQTLLRPVDGHDLGDGLLGWLRAIDEDPDVREQRARGAIDIALVDAQLRAEGRGLTDLAALDRGARPRIYASDLYDSQSLPEIVGLARQYVAAGYTGLKMRLGRRDESWARERLHAVREAIGSGISLMVDAVQGWDEGFCHVMMPELVAARVTWLEDPFTPDAYPDLASLVSWSPIPVCVGESCRTQAQVEAVIETGVPIVMLDIQHLGGIRPTLEAMQMVEAAGRRLTFHVFTDVSAALAVSSDVEWLEWAPLWGRCLNLPDALSPA